MGKLDRAFNQGGTEIAAANDEVHVDFRENFRVRFGALGLNLDIAAAHVLSAAFENQDDVIGRAATGAGEHGFHGARSKVAAAAIRCAVHVEYVAAPSFGNEA